MSSLYIGDGPRERHLIELISDRMEAHKNLTTNILLDFSRFQRGNAIVQNLQKFNSRFKLCLFTPSLVNLGEFWGVQHMKYYITDDVVILTGANLSSSYLTDRLDRYIVIKDSPDLVDFLKELHTVIEDTSDNVGNMKERLLDLFWLHQRENVIGDILMFPFVQLGRFNIRMEEEFFTMFFDSVKNADNIFLSTAYFNPPPAFIKSLSSVSKLSVITSSPRANSFFGEKGVKGLVVPLYEEFQKSEAEFCSLFQWGEKGDHKTFHSKGIWAFDCEQVEGGTVTMTVVGSSNYGMRSINRDLELQMVLLTTNQKLKEELKTEVESVFEGGRMVRDFSLSEAILPAYYKPFIFLFKSFL